MTSNDDASSSFESEEERGASGSESDRHLVDDDGSDGDSFEDEGEEDAEEELSDDASEDERPVTSSRARRGQSANDLALKQNLAAAAEFGLEEFVYRRSSRARKPPERLAEPLARTWSSDDDDGGADDDYEDDPRASGRRATTRGQTGRGRSTSKRQRSGDEVLSREIVQEALGLRTRSTRTQVNYNYDENEYADDLRSAIDNQKQKRLTKKSSGYLLDSDDDDDNDDDDDDDDDDEEYGASAKYSYEDAPQVDAIEMVLDHRVRTNDPESKGEQEAEDDGATVSSSSSSTTTPPPSNATTAVEEGAPQVLEYLIKWKGSAHYHNTWHTADELVDYGGFKTRFKRYCDEAALTERWLSQTATPDEREQYEIERELQRQVYADWKVVDKIVDVRANPQTGASEYFVKWKHLQYGDCTWEEPNPEILDFQTKIDRFLKKRSELVYKTKAAANKWSKDRPTFEPLTQQPKELRGGQLRDYQLAGLNFLRHAWCHDHNAILADEMGLGKTIQSVSLLATLHLVNKLSGPFLVVVPLSTINNWQSEFEKWAPDMDVVVYAGDARSRAVIREYEFYTQAQGSKQKHVKFDVLLSTYELVMKDRVPLRAIDWTYMMVDEAHRLKSHTSVLYQVLSELRTRNCTLITGTPLQNSLEEMWALLHFIMPKKFPVLADFIEQFPLIANKTRPSATEAPEDVEAAAAAKQAEIASLHKELRPYLIRRLKTEVEKSLPAKSERILRVGLAPLQRKYYKWIVSKNFDNLNKGTGSKTTLLNIVVELKKCCNHPYLFPGAEERVDSDPQAIIKSSGKMLLLHKLLLRLKETGHRVLIFSQMVRMLDILSDYLRIFGFQHQRLDGAMGRERRRQAMERFNAPNSKDFVFLLSTRAGGLGINLATADTVIIFDSDWNPQNDLQAESRAHRIGQKNAVNIYRFVTSNSVEEKVVESAKRKMVLEHLVIQSMDTSGRNIASAATMQHVQQQQLFGGSEAAQEFDKQELAAILRFGAAELFKKDADDANTADMEMDLDEILKRAETAPEMVSAGQELLNAFQVTSFGMDNDPDFWARVVPAKALEKEREKQFDALLPRQSRLKDVSYEEGSASASSSSSSSSSSQSSSSSSSSAKKKRSPSASKKKSSAPNKFSEKDTRAIVRSLRKFGASPARLSDVLSDAALTDKTPTAAAEHIQEIIDACRAAAESTDTTNGSDDNKAKQIEVNGVAIPANAFLSRMAEAELLEARVRPHASKNAYDTFRLGHTSVRPVSHWPVEWTIRDDAMLLYGCYVHGIGSWSLIRTDPNLGLQEKICPTFAPKEGVVVWTALQRRFETLIKALAEQSTTPSASASRSRKPSSSSAATSSSKAKPSKDGEGSDKVVDSVKKRARVQNSSAEKPADAKPPARRKATVVKQEKKTAATTKKATSLKKENNDEPAVADNDKPKPRARANPKQTSLPLKKRGTASATSTEKTEQSPKEQLHNVLDSILELRGLPSKQLDDDTRIEMSTKCLLEIGNEISTLDADQKRKQLLWRYVSRITGANADLGKMYIELKKLDQPSTTKHQTKQQK